MARNAEGENSQRGNAGSSTATATRIRARAKPLLLICQCFGFITSVAPFLCIPVNVISATRSFKNGPHVFDGIFRCYAVVIAILVVVAETEWGFVMKFWKVLECWTSRGMLQIFVAVMTRAYPEDSDERKELILLQNIASYMFLACGVVYVISGILRIGILKRELQQKVSREQALRDLQVLFSRHNSRGWLFFFWIPYDWNLKYC